MLPKQADETEFDRGGMWSAVTSSAWNGRRADDGGAQLTGDDVAYCCLPSGCPNYLSDLICLGDLGDAVKVSDTRHFRGDHRIDGVGWVVLSEV